MTSLEFKSLLSFHSDIQIKTNLKEGLFNIIGSKIHLIKTIMNLVSNAMEAMKEGGTVTVATKNRYIDKDIYGYETIKRGNYAIFEISDEGTGISNIDLERIFEPFYTKKKMGQSGTGLGMAVVWGTVKDLKGFIDIKSEIGKGTTFTLYFPITDKEKSLISDDFDINRYLGKNEKILIVDDIEEQRELAYDILTRIGYSVNFVDSGENAIEYLKENSVDLVLLDMIMEPGIDGLETYKKIIEISPNQKAIIVSGYSETERVQEAIKLGVKKYIKKPYSVENLSKAVKKILNQ
jgi:CheY-like chemotaxis protein